MSFDNQAKTWDIPERIERANKLAKIIETEIEKLGISGNAMEFGCGTGLLSFFLREKFDNITMVDTSRGMINVLTQKINEAEVKNMHPLCIDILEEKINLEFDFIFSSLVLHHVEDIDGIIVKFNDLLLDSGKLLIIDLEEDNGEFHLAEKDFKGHNGFNKSEFAEKMIKSGFKNVYANTIYKDIKNRKGKEIEYSLFLVVGEK